MKDDNRKSKEYLLQVFIPVAKEEAEGLTDVINCLDSIADYLNQDHKQSIVELVNAYLQDSDEIIKPQTFRILTELKQKIEEL